MDSLKQFSFGMDPRVYESERLIKTYGISKEQADKLADDKFKDMPIIPLTVDVPRRSLSDHSRSSDSSLEKVIVKTEAHIKEVTIEQAEYTKRQAACYAMVSAGIGAILATGTTLAIHFSNCPKQ